ncbi:hypothetical protein D3C75_1328890 [compost metagenome]
MEHFAMPHQAPHEAPAALIVHQPAEVGNLLLPCALLVLLFLLTQCVEVFKISHYRAPAS